MLRPTGSAKKSKKANEAKAQKRDAKIKRQETIEEWKKDLMKYENTRKNSLTPRVERNQMMCTKLSC